MRRAMKRSILAIAALALAVLAVPAAASATEPIATGVQAGSPGSGTGQLDHPEALAVDSRGHVWVADTGNDRVLEFGPEGEYLSQLGKPGSGNGQLQEPNGIAIDSEGDVWVADAGNKRVQEFTFKGEYLAQYEQWNYRPSGFDLGSEDTFWTGVPEAGCVLKWVAEEPGGPLGVECGIESPRGISVDSEGNAVVTDSAADRVVQLAASGEMLSEFGAPGSGNGQLDDPAGIEVGPDGNLWVADSGNGRVQVFSPEGEYLRQFGKEGGLEEPIDVAADRQEGLWVLDKAGGFAQKWSYEWESTPAGAVLTDENGSPLMSGTPITVKSSNMNFYWNFGRIECNHGEIDAEVLLNAETAAQAEGAGVMQECWLGSMPNHVTGVEMRNLRLKSGGEGTIDLAFDWDTPWPLVCHAEGKLDVTYSPGSSNFKATGDMSVTPEACAPAEFEGYFSLETAAGAPQPIIIS